MSQYMILIYDNEAALGTATPEDWQEMAVAHDRFAKQVVEGGGTIIGGNALQPTSTATTIRKDTVTDGPFAETKEALGGYYIVEARDLDHALEIGKLVPVITGCVEVRPIMVFE